MLNPQAAEQRLKEFSTETPLEDQRARVAGLPDTFRVAALSLLSLKPDETPYITEDNWNKWAIIQKQQEALGNAQKAAYQVLDSLLVAERETFFAALFPGLAPLLAEWWQSSREGAVLYQTGYERRPFRISSDPSRDGGEDGQERQVVLSQLLTAMSPYQEMPVDWLAAWVPYLGAHNADTFGKLFAAAIDRGGPEGDAVFDVLLASGRGDHEVGAMGRHVVRGLLTASRPDGWEFVEKLLLAAQRQEGLRQSILEVIDEAHPQAFRRMLKVIRENDLFRFSATVRAADTWFGMNWVAYEKLSVKQANAAVDTIETFLIDPAGRDEVLASTTDGQTLYLALWSIAFEDARKAMQVAMPHLADSQIERRYAALHLLNELRLEEAKTAVLSALDDADLRVAQKAFAVSNWYEASAVSGSTAVLAARIALGDAQITEAMETVVEPGTMHADLLSGLKEALAEGLTVLEGEEKVTGTTPVAVASVIDDRFERLERNIRRFPAKPTTLDPVIWEWDTLTAHAENLANRLPNLLGARPVERLFPFLTVMGSHGRAQTAGVIGKQKNKTAALREVLLGLVGDSASYVREAAFKALAKFHLTDEETERIEALLTRKSADLRKAALSLLLRRSDDPVLASGERLIGARDANQRLAGLDLLTQMVEKKRSPERARAVVNRFAEARAEKLTSAEKAMLEPLQNEQHEKPTLENALGLMDPARGTVAPRPVEHSRFPYVSDSANAIIAGLNDFIKKHKELPVGTQSYGNSGEETLLGNITHSWQFPHPDITLTPEADAKRLPLFNLLTTWWESRPETMRDADGWELVRAEAALVARSDDPYGEKVKKLAWGQVEALFSTIPWHKEVTPVLVAWLARLYPPQGCLIDFYLDAAESVLARLAAFEDEHGHHAWRTSPRVLAYLHAARLYRRQNPDTWTAAQVTRLWHLMLWVYQSETEAKGRQRLANTDEIAAALRAGAANEHDLYDHLLVRYERSHGSFRDLNELSSRKSGPVLEKTPELRAVVDNCRQRILEVELRRGDTETAASAPACALRYSGGTDVLLKLVVALGKDTFARGYSYYGQTNRSNVFSHLIRATYPGGADTLESFAASVKTSAITDKRLIETAVYAPQWARHVEAALGWEGFADGVWWLHAHTKDNSWSVEGEIREAWAAEIADKTPLTPADLTEGAVDVAWFGRVWATLGEGRWKQIDDAARYASSAGGHKRAQLFADGMLGRLDADELLARIHDNRHQDSLRALGLLPLPPRPVEPEAFEAELLRRYQVMQDFLRTSKQFGAQRQESEKLAARIGMENLARTAGYADPVRLTWAMEAAAVADLKEGAITKLVGDVSVSLAINGLGLPELTVLKNNKTLAAIPPAVKKVPVVAELVARKTQLARQVSRMRESLEGAMCRGDAFTGAELATLLEHPILRPLLGNLVFIEVSGKEPVLGYPIGGNRLEDCDGAVSTIRPDTALRIAHSYDMLQTGRWERWQKDCFLRERVQPFKQVFRELYVLTEAEKADNSQSRRYSGHQVNPKQALALFNKRGWVGGGEYDYDGEGPRKTFHEDGYTVSVHFMGWTATPADVEGSTIDAVHFTRKGDWNRVPLELVPPRVFSEAMRDLDLVVSVAHVGGVDPEASQSTVEMRASLVREAMGLLKIDNVRFEKSHAIIDGTLATYNVHLGSAVVHRQPGGYLCIVPVHSQHRGRLFLPFVDDDPRTAEVISKVLLLAKDRDIKDPTILEQILAVK